MVIPRALTCREVSNCGYGQKKSCYKGTRDQADCPEWKKERKYRFTASSFQLIAKSERNHPNCAQSPVHPIPFPSKHVAHGIKYEPVALQGYEKFV